MTKKDYQKIAAILKPFVLRTDNEEGTREYGAVSLIVQGFADMLAEDNPRFDRTRFYEACGGR